MVLTVAPLYFWLLVLSIQVANLLVPELSHQAYRNSEWYDKIISFLLDSLTAFNNLSHTKKKAVKQASIKYWVTNQHFLYIERGRETTKCLFSYKISSILK